MKAAVYTRYSSSNQREESIEAQIMAANNYCEKKGYTIVQIYKDEALSARTDQRPAFQKMILDATFGLFERLIVHKIDRFARNRIDAAIYKRKLKLAGVKIEYVDQHFDDGPKSIILESLLEGMAEYYSANLSRETMKGLRLNALKGLHNGGLPPFGFDIIDSRYVINEFEAAGVKMIFDLYLQDAGLTML